MASSVRQAASTPHTGSAAPINMQLQKTRQERGEALALANQHFASGEYYKATWKYIAAGDNGKALQCAMRLRWKKEFAGAAEIYEKLGAIKEQAETMYEAGNFFAAATLYIRLYLDGKGSDLHRRIVECAEHAEFLGNRSDAVAIIVAFAKAVEANNFELSASLYAKVAMEDEAKQVYLRKAKEFEQSGDCLEASVFYEKGGDVETAIGLLRRMALAAERVNLRFSADDGKRLVTLTLHAGEEAQQSELIEKQSKLGSTFLRVEHEVPSSARDYLNRIARLLEKSGKLGEAIEVYTKVFDHASNHSEKIRTLLEIARLHEQLGNINDAIRVLGSEDSLELKQVEATLYRKLGNAKKADALEAIVIAEREGIRRENEARDWEIVNSTCCGGACG